MRAMQRGEAYNAEGGGRSGERPTMRVQCCRGKAKKSQEVRVTVIYISIYTKLFEPKSCLHTTYFTLIRNHTPITHRHAPGVLYCLQTTPPLTQVVQQSTLSTATALVGTDPPRVSPSHRVSQHKRLIKLDMWLMTHYPCNYTKIRTTQRTTPRRSGHGGSHIQTSARSASTTRGRRSLHTRTSAALHRRDRSARPPPLHPRLCCAARAAAGSM